MPKLKPSNHPKCLILMFQFWHFSPIIVLLKFTCLVTLFDRKIQVYQKIGEIARLWHFILTFVLSKCKRSSLHSQCWMRLFLWFSNTVKLFSFCWCVIVWFSMGFAKVKALLFLTSTSFESASLLSNLTPAPTFHFYSISSEHLPLLSKHSKMLWFWFKEC